VEIIHEKGKIDKDLIYLESSILIGVGLAALLLLAKSAIEMLKAWSF